MSMTFERCCFMVSFEISPLVDLSVMLGVDSCLCTSSSIVVCMTSPSYVLENKPPNSPSTAEDINFFLIPDMDRIAPLCLFGFEEFGMFPK